VSPSGSSRELSSSLLAFLTDESLSRVASEIVPAATVTSTPVHDGTVFTSGVVVGLSSTPESVSSSRSSGSSSSVGPGPGSFSMDIVETNPVVSSLISAVVDVPLLSVGADVDERTSPSLALSLGTVHGSGVSTDVVAEPFNG